MSCCPQAPKDLERITQEEEMRVIGMDVHRSMAVIAVVEGNRLSSGGRIDLTRDAVIKFGRKLRSDLRLSRAVLTRSRT